MTYRIELTPEEKRKADKLLNECIDLARKQSLQEFAASLPRK